MKCFVFERLGRGVGRSLAAAIVTAAALPALPVGAGETFMWGGASGTLGTLKEAIKWYSDESLTETQGAVSPWDEGSNACSYAVIGTSKWTKDSVFPDVPVYFGRDGVNAGSSKTCLKVNSSCNLVVDIPQAYLAYCAISANSTSARPLTLKGTWRTLDNSILPEFSANNISSDGPRGFDFAGTFISAASSTHYLAAYASGSVTTWRNAYFFLSGDFSSFKGKWRMGNVTPEKLSAGLYIDLRLTSPTAMGDVSCERNDAFELRNGTHLTIAPAVAQSSARGITISNASSTYNYTVYLDTATGEDWTLSTPIYGADATLEIVGTNMVSLASSLEPGNIVIARGVHRILPAASFAPGTVITVRPGATLINATGTDAIPNVTLVVEDGGACRRMILARYNAANGDVATVDATGLSFRSEAPGLELQFDGVLTAAPTSRVFRIATLSASEGWSLDNIAVGRIDREYGTFPKVSLSLEEEGGQLVLKGAVNPTVWRTGGDTLVPLTARYTYRDGGYTETPVWSDGLAAHAGADYVMALDGAKTATALASSTEAAAFPGDSLYTETDIISRTSSLTAENLTLADGARIVLDEDSPSLHEICGGISILGDTSFIGTTNRDGTAAQHGFRMNAAISGGEGSTVTFTSEQKNRVNLQWNSSCRDYRGKFVFGKNCPSSWYSTSLWVLLGDGADGCAFGGDLDDFTPDAVRWGDYSMFQASRTMTIGARNRAFLNSGNAGFSVGANATLTLDSPLAMGHHGYTQLFKVGSGCLKLNGPMLFCAAGDPSSRAEVTPGRNNRIAVQEGYILPPDEYTNGYAQAFVLFSAGTGIAVAPGSPNPYGVYATITNAFAMRPNVNDIKIRLNASADDLAGMTKVVTPVCTLTNTHSELTFTVLKPGVRGWSGTLVEEGLPGLGLVRRSVVWRKFGMVLVVR